MRYVFCRRLPSRANRVLSVDCTASCCLVCHTTVAGPTLRQGSDASGNACAIVDCSADAGALQAGDVVIAVDGKVQHGDASAAITSAEVGVVDEVVAALRSSSSNKRFPNSRICNSVVVLRSRHRRPELMWLCCASSIVMVTPNPPQLPAKLQRQRRKRRRRRRSRKSTSTTCSTKTCSGEYAGGRARLPRAFLPQAM